MVDLCSGLLIAAVVFVFHVYLILRLNRIEHNINGLVEQGRTDSRAAGKTEGKAEEKAAEAERDEAADENHPDQE